MVGHSFQHLTRHGQHPWRYLLAGLLAVLTCLLLSETAAAGPFPAEFELSSLFPAAGGDGSAGFVLKGVDPDDGSGCAVSNLGDINGDGIDDLIIGARGAAPNGQVNAGESYVVFGRTTGFPAVLNLASLFPAAGGDGSAGFVLKGIAPGDFSGYAVSGLGDVNSDGVDDLVIGAYAADPNEQDAAGESYVVFGRTTGFPARVELARLLPEYGGDGSAGFVLKGVDPDDYLGRSVSGLGDINGDGIHDLIVGAPDANWIGQWYVGESYVVFGRTTGFPAAFDVASLFPKNGGDGSAGFVLTGDNEQDFSGTAVSGLGDVNGDGIDDLIIGARGAAPNGQVNAGESYVVFGRTTGFPALVELANLSPAGFVLNGVDSGDQSGDAVSGLGDVNGDGVDDFVIGASNASPNQQDFAGESYVVFGRTTRFPETFHLASLFPALGGDGSAGFVLKGVDAVDYSGNSVSGLGDVNGDGIDDLIIGAFHADAGGVNDAGESYVVFGRTTGFPATFHLASLFPAAGGDGTDGFVLKGVDPRDHSGISVSGLGDINGDGIDDLIIGAYWADPNGQAQAGESYVVFGRVADTP